MSREAVAYRLDQLERAVQHGGHVASGPVPEPVPGTRPEEPRPPAAAAAPGPPDVELEQLQEAWQRTILPAVEEKGGIPTASLLREAHPSDLAGDTLTLAFPPAAEFHRKLAEEPKNATVLRDTLYEVTGRRLAVAFEVGDAPDGHDEEEPDGPVSEEEILQLMKDTFDAEELERE
jgi:hypothetical protein